MKWWSSCKAFPMLSQLSYNQSTYVGHSEGVESTLAGQDDRVHSEWVRACRHSKCTRWFWRGEGERTQTSCQTRTMIVTKTYHLTNTYHLTVINIIVSLRMSTSQNVNSKMSTSQNVNFPTPKMSTHKMWTSQDVNFPKCQLPNSQDVNSQDVNFPRCQLPECQLPECQLPECQLFKF